MGNLDQAVTYLERIDPNFPYSADGQLQQIIYHLNRCSVYLLNNALMQADQEVVLAETILHYENLSPNKKDQLSRDIQAQKYSIQMHQGDYSGAEEFFEAQLQAENTLRGKVVNKWVLADIYHQKNDPSKAAEACQYVIEHGGETKYVQKAKDLLNQQL